jgi:hypothetical protein
MRLKKIFNSFKSLALFPKFYHENAQDLIMYTLKINKVCACFMHKRDWIRTESKRKGKKKKWEYANKQIHPTLVERKNVENKNECVGEDLWVRVRATKVSPVFSTFIFSAFLSFDQSRVNQNVSERYFWDTLYVVLKLQRSMKLQFRYIWKTDWSNFFSEGKYEERKKKIIERK